MKAKLLNLLTICKMPMIVLTAFIGVACLTSCGDDEIDETGSGTGGVGHIEGSVVIGGEPVNAAAVLLTPGGGTSITGSDGTYRFYNLEQGTYEIKVYKEGCLPFNRQVTVNGKGKTEELVLTLSPNNGDLLLNKGFIDMGSNQSNNLAAFAITNKSDKELEWSATNAASWISKIEPRSGKLPAGGSAAVTVTITRSRLSAQAQDNYASVVVKSTTAGNGSTAELLVTVFGSGNGTNTENDNSDLEYIIIGDLYVQTKDIGQVYWNDAKRLCENSLVGGYNDWRLPTLDELTAIFNKKKEIGGFVDGRYWSSSLSSNSSYPYYCLDMSTGASDDMKNNNYYYVRAVRKDKPKVVAQVSTLSPNQMTATTAMLHGRIDDAGYPTYTERGFVYAANKHRPTIEDTKLISYTNASSVEFEETAKDLSMNTDYYVRAYATNAIGTAYGEEIKLRIEEQGPTVVTLPVSDLAETSVIMHGKIESLGIPEYTQRGFVYSSTFNKPTIDDDNVKTVTGTGLGEFSANLRDLTEGQTYYVRAFAKNDKFVSYGETVSFKPESPNYVILETEGIMVQKNDLGSAYWNDADRMCKNSTVGGFTDWRLPTLDELMALYNKQEKIGGFKRTNTGGNYAYTNRYWSSTVSLGNSSYYYYISFLDGTSGTTHDTSWRYQVRAVRTIKK